MRHAERCRPAPSPRGYVDFGHARLPSVPRPLAPYVGGKRNLAVRICGDITKIPHRAYAEPFAGMGGIFFRRAESKPLEIINDLNRDVATLFRVVQRYPDALSEMLDFHLCARSDFEHLLLVDPQALTDLERATRFLVLQRTGFGGLVSSRKFAGSKSPHETLTSRSFMRLIELVHERLAGVVIECLPWQTFVSRHDGRGILFYVDPPYWGVESTYGGDSFSREDFNALSDALRGLKGTFLLSLNDVPEVRRLFRWARVRGVTTTYSACGHGRRREVDELLISPQL